MAPSTTVTATETSLSVLEALKRLDGAGVTAVARDLDLPKSTVHNHLSTLARRGYVVNEDGEYRVGLRFLEFGEHSRNRMTIYDVSRPEVAALAEETGELANLAVEELGEGVYVVRSEGPQAVRVDVHAGNRVNLHCTALGKAILSQLPASRVEEILDRHGLPERTDRTITDRAELDAELAEVRDRGYAYDREERLPGLRCVAAPVTGGDDGTVAAVSVSGPTTRIKGDRFHEEIPELVRSAANVIEINATYS